MLKKIGAVLAGAVAAALLVSGTAAAVSTYRTGGTTDRQYFATSDNAWLEPGVNVWQTVPNTVVTVNVTGRRQLLTASFSAESLCTGSGWCSVRVVYLGGSSGLTELVPAAGTDYAFDSDGDSYDQHTVNRSSEFYLRPGVYRVWVQAQRVGASAFRLDDYHLALGLVSP